MKFSIFSMYRVERHVVIYVLFHFDICTTYVMGWWPINNNFFTENKSQILFFTTSHNIPSFQNYFYKFRETKKTKKKIFLCFNSLVVDDDILTVDNKKKEMVVSSYILLMCKWREWNKNRKSFTIILRGGKKLRARRITFVLLRVSISDIFLSFRWCLTVSWFVHRESPSFPIVVDGGGIVRSPAAAAFCVIVKHHEAAAAAGPITDKWQ